MVYHELRIYIDGELKITEVFKEKDLADNAEKLYKQKYPKGLTIRRRHNVGVIQ